MPRSLVIETFRTDFGLARFVEEYTNAIQQLRAAGYTTNFLIDAPNWGQDYIGGVDRLKELQKVDANILLGVHLYDGFLDPSAIEDAIEGLEELVSTAREDGL